jgi:predicted amidophosphoribosyltransferase
MARSEAMDKYPRDNLCPYCNSAVDGRSICPKCGNVFRKEGENVA